jgi:hypothetical protein
MTIASFTLFQLQAHRTGKQGTQRLKKLAQQ